MSDGYRTINFNGTITSDELFDDNGKIKQDLMPTETLEYVSHKCTSASDTPAGIIWNDEGTTIVGTLTASHDTQNIVYFVKNNDSYDQYITFIDGSSYYWGNIGNTLINNVSGMTYTVVN